MNEANQVISKNQSSHLQCMEYTHTSTNITAIASFWADGAQLENFNLSLSPEPVFFAFNRVLWKPLPDELD